MVKLSTPPEHAEQVVLLHWWEMQARAKGIAVEHLFAIPNGGNRNAITGARLKAEGVRAGIPDLMLALPVLNRPGLFIEMKRKKGGRLGREQERILQLFSAAGYAVAVCHGCDEAREVICRYLGWEREKGERAPKRKAQGIQPWENWGDMGDEHPDSNAV